MEGSGVHRHLFEVPDEHDRCRLDKVVAALVPTLSRRAAKVVIDLGGVFVDKRRVKASSRTVRTGQRIEVVIGAVFERATKRVGRSARRDDEAGTPVAKVLFEDDEIVVVDKPAGLPTAPTRESDRGNLLSQLQDERGHRLHLVHRLDMLTSGILVISKTVDSSRVLSERWRTHDVERRYWMVVEGDWPSSVTHVDAALDGKAARTDFVVHERLASATILHASLATGRTHQIRRHTSGLGHPVAGDRKYGSRLLRPPRLALQAGHLGFLHPATAEPLSFDVEVPSELVDWLSELGQSDEEGEK